MAYKISYKVAAEQAEQLKNIAKDMDNYVNQVNQIVGKLGNDELLQSVRNDLNKFKKQLEEEKTILNLASSVISDVIQSFSGVEKKSGGKVDKAKAHNRDFYKRPVAVASAGGGAATARASGGSAIAQSQTVVHQNVSNTTNNVSFSGHSGSGSYSSGSGGFSANTGTAASGVAGVMKNAFSQGAGAAMDSESATVIGSAIAAAGGLAATGAAILGAKKDEEKLAAGAADKDNVTDAE